MPASASVRARLSRVLFFMFIAILFAAYGAVCPAASIRGVVTDPSGAKVTGAVVDLLSGGKVVASAVSTADGSYQILTGVEGRFFLVVSAKSFRQLETPGFYAGKLDNIERNLVLEPEWVRESIVVTATGTPTPQAQTSAATSVLGPLDLDLRDDMAVSYTHLDVYKRQVCRLHLHRGPTGPGYAHLSHTGQYAARFQRDLHVVSRDRAHGVPTLAGHYRSGLAKPV